ncbi:MAG: hypothetical protein KCHDKBKB_03118 [Elusimicrobia bacterium]|nr:hypothetical protein [Elusimicrobiota bacterium]
MRGGARWCWAAMSAAALAGCGDSLTDEFFTTPKGYVVAEVCSTLYPPWSTEFIKDQCPSGIDVVKSWSECRDTGKALALQGGFENWLARIIKEQSQISCIERSELFECLFKRP